MTARCVDGTVRKAGSMGLNDCMGHGRQDWCVTLQNMAAAPAPLLDGCIYKCIGLGQR